MRILYVQYTNPGAYPPLVRGAQILSENGATVRMLGTRVRGTDELDVPAIPGIDARLMPEPAGGWRLKAHYARYAAWVGRQALLWKPDWIYASDVLSAPIALGLGAGTRAHVVYHEHDAPSQEHESWMIGRCMVARRRVVQRASLVVAPNAERAKRLSALGGGRPVFTVWNCPRRPTQRPAMEKGSDGLRIIFRGSVNSERLPLTIVDAIGRLDSPMTLDIAGYETVGSRGYLGAIRAQAEALGIDRRVRVLGTVKERELAAICQQCDVGLALMPMQTRDENMAHMTGASNKLFEYLSFGLAPLVSDLPDWRRTFVDPGYAFACKAHNADSIAEAFRWATAHRGELRSIADRGWQRLRSDWNYESQFAPVLRAILGRDATMPNAVCPRDVPDERAVEAECAS